MIYLVLGSNLGDREWNLEQAKALLAEALKVDMICSQVLETDAVGFRFLDIALHRLPNLQSWSILSSSFKRKN